MNDEANPKVVTIKWLNPRGDQELLLGWRFLCEMCKPERKHHGESPYLAAKIFVE